MAKAKSTKVVDNRVEVYVETHDVFTKKAEAYARRLRKNPAQISKFLKETGILDADGNLAKEYKGRGTRSHAY